VDADLHIADVVSVLDVEDLEDAVPLGHSYAGTVTSGDADQRGERLGTLVWLDSSPVPDGMAGRRRAFARAAGAPAA
jgi:pimeloyl-ACP methyl ester carboxylesterase